MSGFSLLEDQLGYLTDSQVETVESAYLFAKSAHEGQFRRSGEPYIVHPLHVAMILSELKMDQASLVAGLLHDVVEDTEYTLEQVSEKFGEEVAYIVDGVSKITRIKFRNKIEEQAENFRKMLLAMSRDIRVIIIKLADRLHNMRTIGSLPIQKQKFKAYETLEIYAPIAKRLGMHGVCLELENIGFKTLYPARYRVLKFELDKVQKRHKKAIEQICHAINRKLVDNDIKPHWIKSRGKHIYSIYKKIKHTHLSFSKLTDVFGIRVCLDTVQQCYLTLGLVHMTYRPMSQRFKDYIAIPKANGYQSLHTVLFGPSGMPIEVQIRTNTMDAMAERGIAAHWLYKTGRPSSIPDINKQQWLKNLIELQQKTGSSIEFLQNVKTDIFSDSVFVFTTTGEVIEMPQGSVILDLAFEMSEDIGLKCVAARVNRDFAPLSSQLATGQVVEIIDAEDAKPSRTWLAVVKSSKARASLKAYFEQQKEVESIELGKKLFIKAMNDYSIDSTQFDMTRMRVLLPEKFQNTTDDQLYEYMGLGLISPKKICKQYVDKHMHETDVSVSALPITGAEGMAIDYSHCCLPIPGDPIVGVIKSGSGVIIHRSNCQVCRRLLKSKNFEEMPVCWSSKVTGDFGTILAIEVINQRGVLAAIVVTISDLCSGIEDVFIDGHSDTTANIKVKLKVSGRKQVAQLIRSLKRLRQVLQVHRTIEGSAV